MVETNLPAPPAIPGIDPSFQRWLGVHLWPWLTQYIAAEVDARISKLNSASGGKLAKTNEKGEIEESDVLASFAAGSFSVAATVSLPSDVSAISLSSGSSSVSLTAVNSAFNSLVVGVNSNKTSLSQLKANLTDAGILEDD